MSTVLVRYRIARTGQPVPSGSPPPPDYVPWPHAPITWTRTELDYGPGIVRPRDSITTRADEHGEGAVYLAPGRYRITLPSRDTRDVTVSAGLDEIDLSALLAGGGVEPDDPAYPTLAAYVVDQIGVALEDQLDAIDEAVETAESSAATAESARDAALLAQAEAESARDAAVSARQAAESARDDAEGYATTAQAARDQAVAAQGAAESAASAASSHASAAAESASAAQESATAAAGYASAAAGSATAAQTAQGHAEDARDAAQGYATAAQGYATTASEAAEDAEAARDAVLGLVPDPALQPDGRVLVTRGGVLAYAPDLAAALAHGGLHPQRHFAFDVFPEGEGNFPGTGDTAASGQTYTRVAAEASAQLFAVVPDAPEAIEVRYWAYNYGNQTPVILLKYIDADNHLYIENHGTGGIRIVECVDGVKTVLASANPPSGPQRRRLGVEWYGAYLSDGASRTVIARVDTGPEITATPSAIFDGSHAVGIGIGSGSISYAWSVTHLSRQS